MVPLMKRSLAALVSALTLVALPACSAGPEEPASVEQELAQSVAARVILRGTLTAGDAVRLDYSPAEGGYAGATGVPFLALELLPAESDDDGTDGTGLTPRNATDAAQTITVRGDFPGTPSALVVSEDRRVLAVGETSVTEEGLALATIRAPRSAGRRFLVVRDERWVRPMAFEVRAGR